MAQAWASLAVLTAGSQAAPKIPTSCRRSSDRSQTVVQLPACLAPQFEPHVVPSRRVPRLSSLALTRIRQRLLGCRIFTPAQPSHSAASSEGFLLRRLQGSGNTRSTPRTGQKASRRNICLAPPEADAGPDLAGGANTGATSTESRP